MSKLYFLGPCGTFSELAALKMYNFLNKRYTLECVSTISKIVDILNDNQNDVGILPIENSIEGIVRPTIDAIYASDVSINLQLEIKIEHCLMSKGDKKNIKHIISHPQALAQCQKYILENFDKNIDLINSTSTAHAVLEILDKDESYSAIASYNLANKNNLIVHDKNISDNKENKTRFVLVSKSNIVSLPKTRTSIVFNTKNESGALLKILKIFYKYNLNLIYLESRPSKVVFGEYNFFADIDKGIDEVSKALNEIGNECNFYKLLGSYSNIEII